MSAPLLEARGVRFSYDGRTPVLPGTDFTLDEGGFLGLIGPNGAGKSTLLHLLSGWLRPQEGEVRLSGRPLRSYTARELALRIAVVLQREEHTFDFNALDLVLMGRFAHGAGTLGFETDADRGIALEALAMAGLEGFENRRASELSGGEYQRLTIARALAQQAPILLLDEPSASLDLAHQRMLYRLLDRLNREEGRTILVVSHDINSAAAWCRELALLQCGRVVRRAAPRELLRPDILAEAYGVPVTVHELEDGQPLVAVRR